MNAKQKRIYCYMGARGAGKAQYEKEKYIKQLQQENKQLKEKEELHLNRIDELTDRVVDLKSVIEEVKEYIESNCENFYVEEPHYRDLVDSIDILDIVNKALGDKDVI